MKAHLLELQQMQWLGSVDAARDNGVNLVTLVGNELSSPRDFDAQANIVFDLISSDRFDGLIVWPSTVNLFAGREEMIEFCRRFQGLPMVSVEEAIPGATTLLMDDRQGMHAAVSHLIETHGHRRIAFIRGPESHAGARERYAAYREAMTEHGLAIDPSLIAPPAPSWRPEEIASWVAQLISEPTSNVDAIAAANDDLALGTLTVLRSRHVRVPEDVAVVGFDDTINIKSHDLALEDETGASVGTVLERAVNLRGSTLPLTTVRAPFYQLGYRSLELILGLVRGETVPDLVTVPSELIVRRSCGCFSPEVRQLAPSVTLGPATVSTPEVEARPMVGAISGSGVAPSSTPAEASASIEPEAAVWRSVAESASAIASTLTSNTAPAPPIDRIADELRRRLTLPRDGLSPGWVEQLVSAFFADLRGGSEGMFLNAFDELVRLHAQTKEDLEVWWQIVFTLSRELDPYLGDQSVRAQSLWQQVQVLLWETAELFSRYEQLVYEKRAQIVGDIGQRLITALDLGRVADVLVEDLPQLGIESCYLTIYTPEPGSEASALRAGAAQTYPTEMARSLLVYNGGHRRELPTDGSLFRTMELVPGPWPIRDDPTSTIVAPLYFKDQHLGFVLFESGPRLGWVYHALQDQLSSALQAALLVDRAQRAMSAVEESKLVLEQRVGARTAELARANETLTEQMLERERAEELRARLEAQLRQVQKMDAIGRLAGGIAHDFNNLLVVINGYSDLLLSYAVDDDSMRRDIEQIRQAGERAAALTRQLLAFGRKQMLQPRVLDLNDVVSHVERMLERLIGEDVDLMTVLDPDLAPIKADPGQLEQIIVNLAVNARDAMPHGGRLVIETTNVTLGPDYAFDHVGVRIGRYVLLKVSDSGIGMDASVQAHLFEPFFTTKPQGAGTGLGLATVFGIVQQSGGHISVSSAPGQGTTFNVYLPQSGVLLTDEPEGSTPRSSHSGSETILLVEDDGGVRRATRRFLEEYGYNVLEASRSAEALRKYEEHGGRVDLVITDVVMPDGGGRELVNRLAQLHPETPVLLVSGYADSPVVEGGSVGDAATLLQKPFTAEALTRRVREILDGRTADRPQERAEPRA